MVLGERQVELPFPLEILPAVKVASPACSDPLMTVCGPTAPPATGVTVIWAMAEDDPGSAGVKEGIFPVPLAARPMAGLSFVQLNMVPEMLPLRMTAAVDEPLQTYWSGTGFRSGVVLTTTFRTVADAAEQLPLYE